ncbi:uncharacterized protein LOC121405537 [Drosophila obscura]|uniref:uncharacterized protein LOC121405537 n=1 Tax=Drosophila obscura TaxID=7282 RepID=UPI001BB2B7FD|nr:uncharacterized protein LOC121405537 [Drosophila obscura]
MANNSSISESECKSCMQITLSLGLSLVLQYLSATSEMEQPETHRPQPVPRDTKMAKGSVAPASRKHPRNQLRENQMGHFYKCLYCPKVFQSRYDRNAHQKGHQEKENILKFGCAWKRCSSSFETERNLWKHQRMKGHHCWTICCWRCKLPFPNFKSQMAHTKSKRCIGRAEGGGVTKRNKLF